MRLLRIGCEINLYCDGQGSFIIIIIINKKVWAPKWNRF